MDKPELDLQLEQLHAELGQVTTVDENERQLLQALAGDIQELLSQGAANNQEPLAQVDAEQARKYRRLSARLRDGVERLETSHPTVTMLMGQVVDALAKMGI